MIDKKMIPVGGLKKEPFSGSHHGMRYFFQCDESKETFTVFVYPEPWSLEKTPNENKQSASFPLSAEGMDCAIKWLWEMYDTQKKEWNTASKNRMHI
ncbi:hypothetical protein [Mediterraneibacter agrestimuris]|uniref:hypothetical protein n=1 Tax=Mediterraneibacter agrestimuris TaxID=2941333 RepID=UPI0020400C35|nr:hypothetical protein [Mediterraneibacter agrestimuris]